MSKLYLSGPITGLEIDEARERFAAAQELMESQGWETVNPMDNGVPVEAAWEEHLAADIINLFACKAIAMLPGWQLSQGARLEHALARKIGMRIIEVEI